MARIVVSEFVTLDGVMEAPNEWSFPYWNDDIAQFKAEEMLASGGLLLGRITYDGFAAAWPKMKDQPGGDFMNNSRKYVVSNSLNEASWNNSQVIRGNVMEEISRLKEQLDQDLLVYGSGMLIQALAQNDLVDVYRLLVYPIVWGHGKRLFQEGTTARLKLLEARPTLSGVVAQVYEPERSKTA